MFWSEIVDNKRAYSLVEELANAAGGDVDWAIDKVATIIQSKVIHAVLDPVPNPDKSEIAEKIASDIADPTTLQFLIDRLGPGIETVIRNAFNEAIREIESARFK